MSKITGFINKHKLPIPTNDEPLVQVDWIFEQKASLAKTKSHHKATMGGHKYYKTFLNETYNHNDKLKNKEPFYLSEQWTITALQKFKFWLYSKENGLSEKPISSARKASILTAVNMTMLYAYEHNYIKEKVLPVWYEKPIRETEIRSYYTDEEIRPIIDLILSEIVFSEKILEPYENKGVGKDPRTANLLYARTKFPEGEGWKYEENIIWYFENVLNCKPLLWTEENDKEHRAFFHAAKECCKGYKNFYKKLNIWPLIDQDIIIPLVAYLAYLTGLNVESILSLRRDCLKKDIFLDTLALHFYKERSKGEMPPLILSLYDKQDNKLGSKESKKIIHIIRLLQRLTESLVYKAKDEYKDFLLIYETSAPHNIGNVNKLNTRVLKFWCDKLVNSNNLVDRNGQRLSFNLSRFRPTKLTNLIKNGYDIPEIQAVAGHNSPLNTIDYIDKIGTDPIFNKTTHEVISQMRINHQDFKENPLSLAKNLEDKPEQFIFKTPLCSCKNPYDPPEQVKRSNNYNEGDACTYWNMCLFCPKVLITKDNLPDLVAYRSQLEISLSTQINEMPYQGELYQKTKFVLDDLLKPDNYFSDQEIDWANKIAKDNNLADQIYDSFINQ